MAKPLFDEPFNLAYIATVLLDDRFFASVYVLCGERERWEACADQLPDLFLAFMREDIPDHRLYKLAALMFQWTFRFFAEEAVECQSKLIKSLDFIDQERWQNLVASAQTQTWDGIWQFRHPWAPWTEKRMASKEP